MWKLINILHKSWRLASKHNDIKTWKMCLAQRNVHVSIRQWCLHDGAHLEGAAVKGQPPRPNLLVTIISDDVHITSYHNWYLLCPKSIYQNRFFTTVSIESGQITVQMYISSVSPYCTSYISLKFQKKIYDIHWSMIHFYIFPWYFHDIFYISLSIDIPWS